MSSIVTCPECQGAISLPPGMVARLECPHCHHQLSLQATTAPERERSIPPRQVAPAVPIRVSAPAAAPDVSSLAEYRQRLSKRSQRPSALGQMVGILAGGALGMVMGYYLLNYFGGPRYDFLQIPLPGVAHTNGRQPAEPAPPLAAGPLRPIDQEEVPPQRPLAMPAPAAEQGVQPAVAIVPVNEPAPREFPRYSSSELGQALAAAHAASGCENCQSTGFIQRVEVTGVSNVGGKQIERKAERRVPCDVCGGKPTGKITPEFYTRLCQLAEVVTFVEIAPGDPQLLHRKEAVELVLQRAAVDREKQNALGRRAGYQMSAPIGGTTGVLLAGTVQDIGREGELYRTRIVLFGLPEVVTVVSSARPPLGVQDRVLIAGSIVDNPAANLAGYDGSLPRVVWGGLTQKLPRD